MTTLYQLVDSIDQQLSEASQKTEHSGLQDLFAAEHEQLKKYILVRFGTEHLAIPIEDLAEVGPLPTVTRLPNLPEWILGIINLREEVVSVIDFHHFLLGADQSEGKGKQLVVVENSGMKLGLCIDDIVGPASLTDSEKIAATGTTLNRTAPGVFEHLLNYSGMQLHILEANKLFKLEKLINYYGDEQ